MYFNIEKHDERFESIIDRDCVLGQVATGLRFLREPTWRPGDCTLIFSDIMGNGLFKKHQGDGIEIFRENSYLANGNTYDLEGRLLTCEHATSRMTRMEFDGTSTVLAAHHQRKEFDCSNDIVVTSDGSMHFTDPDPGRMSREGIPRKQELDFQGVSRIDADGELTLLVDDFPKPNGLCFSSEGKKIFINDIDHQHIRSFEVTEKGTLSGGVLWADLFISGDEPSVADGMKFDSVGYLYCSSPGRVQVFDEKAKLLGRFPTPEVAANFTWGAEDMKSFYMTASTSLQRLRL